MTQETYDYTADDTWDMTAEKGGGGSDWETCPQGNYPATIVALIDVGHHEEENDKGERYDSRKLVLVVETQKKTSKGDNFVLPKMYTWSMRDNSNWYKLVCSLTGRKFAEGEKFDPRQVLGLACMANVTNTNVTDKKGKPRTYDNLDAITQFPDAFPAPTEFRKPIAWSVKEGLPGPGFGWVKPVYGKSIEKLCNESKEGRGFKAGNGSAKPSANPVADQVQEQIKAAPAANTQAADQDVPF